MTEDETATLLSVQLDGDDIARLVNEAEVLPVDLALKKQLNLQTEMDSLMSYFRDSAKDMQRRASIASSMTNENSIFDGMKSGKLLWENAIPEDSVVDHDEND